MATNGKDRFRQLVADVEGLQISSRSISEGLGSMSDTMAVMAKTMASMSKSMTELSRRMGRQEHLLGRVAKTLIAFKEQTDERFDAVEDRLLELESSRH